MSQRIMTAIPLLRHFWRKATTDGISNLSAMLAYYLLVSFFPLLLVIVAVAGFVLKTISRESQAAFYQSLVHALPSGIGDTFVTVVVQRLQQSAGLLLLLGVLTSVFTGSRLFIAIEQCSVVIFHLPRRKIMPQNLMALGMTVVYIILVPSIFAASALPAVIFHVVGITQQHVVAHILLQGCGFVLGLAAATILFGAMYIIVPNRRARWTDVWRGALGAGIGMVLYENLFPLYTTLVLKSSNYGALAGFALMIMAFFYYLGFILLLGMEINAWVAGRRTPTTASAAMTHHL